MAVTVAVAALVHAKPPNCPVVKFFARTDSRCFRCGTAGEGLRKTCASIRGHAANSAKEKYGSPSQSQPNAPGRPKTAFVAASWGVWGPGRTGEYS